MACLDSVERAGPMVVLEGITSVMPTLLMKFEGFHVQRTSGWIPKSFHVCLLAALIVLATPLTAAMWPCPRF